MKKVKIFIFIIFASLLLTNIFLSPNSVINLDIKSFFDGNTITSLDTPTGLTWKDGSTATAKWNSVTNANYYYLEVFVYNTNDELLGSQETGTADTEIDLQQEIFGIVGDSKEELRVKYNVKAAYLSTTDDEVFSETSVLSEVQVISERVGTIKLETPTNVTINDDLIASWTDIPEAYSYYLSFSINNSSNSMLYTSVFRNYSSNYSYGTSSNGVFTADLTTALDSIYATYMTRANYQSGTISIKFQVMAVAERNSNYADGEFSVYSNTIQYTNSSITQLGTPTNVTINDDLIASWTDIPEAYSYYLSFGINNSSNSGLYTSVFRNYSSNYSYGTSSNGVFTADLTTALDSIYATYMTRTNYQSGTISIKFQVKAIAERNSNFTNGEFSVYSNTILYNSEGNPNISSITLSPNRPVIGVGRSIYMGKTINPENAYYTTINWSSADSNIVSIDNMGRITGVSKGNADITATINNASQSVNVRVYEIESNINDSNTSSIVIDSANDAIENIVNNNDSSGTDTSNINTVVGEINNVIDSGNEFQVGLNVLEKDNDYYDDSEARIKSMVGNSYEILGGYDVYVELFYEQNSYHKHITNLTELNNKINFAFEFTDNNVPEGKTREYRVVRLHGNSVQEVDFNISDNNMSISSDKFSDFVVVYRDVDVGTVPLDIDFENNEITLEKWDDDDPFGDASILELLGATITSMNPEIVQVNNTRIRAVGIGDVVVVVSFDNGNYSVPITIHVVEREFPIKGDIADSGDVDVDDVVLSLRKAFGYEELTDYDVLAADVNGDEVLDIDDVILILRYAFGYIDSLDNIS